jgi:hypothetical protein
LGLSNRYDTKNQRKAQEKRENARTAVFIFAQTRAFKIISNFGQLPKTETERTLKVV